MVDYNPNIPASSDNLSTSQGQIQNNFTQLNTIFDVDHVTFNDATSANRGFHRKVRLSNVASDPVLVSPQTQLYSKTISGAEQLFFANASTVTQITGLTSSIVGNGSITLPGGLVLIWGTIAAAVNNVVQNFHTAFPTACFNVQVTISIGSTVSPVGINGFTRTGFTFRTTASGGVPITYFAIGN